MEDKVEETTFRGVEGLEELKSDTGNGKGIENDLQRQESPEDAPTTAKQDVELSGAVVSNPGKEDARVGRVSAPPKERPPAPQALRWQQPTGPKRPMSSNEFLQRISSDTPGALHRPQPHVLPQGITQPLRPQPALLPIWPPQVIMGHHRGGIPSQLSMMPPPPPSQQGHQLSQQSLHIQQQQKVGHVHLQQRPSQSVGGQHAQVTDRGAPQQLVQRPSTAMHPPQNQSNNTHLPQQRQRALHPPSTMNMPQQPAPRSHSPSHHHLQQMAASGMLARGPQMFGPGMASGSQPMMTMQNFHEVMAMQPAMMRAAGVMHGAFPMLPHMPHMQMSPQMGHMRFVARPNGPQMQGFWRPSYVPAQPPPPPVESNPGVKEKEKAADNVLVVTIGDRMVRLLSDEDQTPLYALCRRWLKNDMLRREEPIVPRRRPIPLPRPLPLSAVVPVEEPSNGSGCQPMEEDTNNPTTSSDHGREENGAKRPEDMTTEELLDSHLERFRSVKKRLRDARAQRVARFKPRLAMLLPSGNENKFETTLTEHIERALTTPAA